MRLPRRAPSTLRELPSFFDFEADETEFDDESWRACCAKVFGPNECDGAFCSTLGHCSNLSRASVEFFQCISKIKGPRRHAEGLRFQDRLSSISHGNFGTQ